MKKFLLIIFILSTPFVALAQSDFMRGLNNVAIFLGANPDDAVWPAKEGGERWLKESTTRSALSFSLGMLPSHNGYGSYYMRNNDEGKYHHLESYEGSLVSLPSFNLSYLYRINKLLEFELILGYNHTECRMLDVYTDAYKYSEKSNILSLVPVMKFNWFDSKLVTFYSSIGFGFDAYFDKNIAQGAIPNSRRFELGHHLTVLGLSVGDKIFTFLELGSSSFGVVRFGAGYRFDMKPLTSKIKIGKLFVKSKEPVDKPEKE